MQQPIGTLLVLLEQHNVWGGLHAFPEALQPVLVFV
jgi:hypothetical protein